MSKIKTGKKKVSPAKMIKEEIITQLWIALPGLKEILGQKKFESRIKKAAKILSAGIQTKKSKKTKLL